MKKLITIVFISLFVTIRLNAQSFEKDWITPFNPMVFYIYDASLNDQKFQPGDVIGIFDIDPFSGEEICVGFDTIRFQLSDTTYMELFTTMNDGLIENQSNGFSPGNSFIFKINSLALGLIEGVEYEFPFPGYDESFTKRGKAIVKLTAQLQNVICAVRVVSNPVEGGVFTGSSNYYFGDLVTLEAIAYNGFEFKNWTENGVILSTQPNYSFTVEGNRNIVVNFDTDLRPPSNLQAVKDGNNVILTWDETVNINNGQWLHYDDGISSNSLGLTSGGTFFLAAKWNNLGQYQGWAINKVAFFPVKGNSYFTLKIWKGQNASTLVHSQAVGNFTIGEWNEVFLEENIPIDITKPLYIGFECTHISGIKPAGADDGPAIATFGDLISTNGTTWYSLKNDLGLNVNWSLQVYIENNAAEAKIARGKPVKELKKCKDIHEIALEPIGLTKNSGFPKSEFLGYKVYCNDWPIANYLQETTFVHEGLGFGNYFYMVRARYDRGQSSPTNIEEVEVFPQEHQAVSLPSGWSGISLYPETQQSVSGQIAEQLGDTLISMGNLNGSIVKNSGSWDRKSGYFIKVSDPCQINISGVSYFDDYVELNQGWNLIPVLSECSCTPLELITTAEIKAIIDVAETGVYWPEKEIQTLQELIPGKSYYIFMSQSGVLGFPGCK